MRRILITGASGFLGFRTIEYLVEQSDFHIIAAARTRRDERMIISDRVQYFFGDLTDTNYVQSLFKTPIFASTYILSPFVPVPTVIGKEQSLPSKHASITEGSIVSILVLLSP